MSNRGPFSLRHEAWEGMVAKDMAIALMSQGPRAPGKVGAVGMAGCATLASSTGTRFRVLCFQEHKTPSQGRDRHPRQDKTESRHREGWQQLGASNCSRPGKKSGAWTQDS